MLIHPQFDPVAIHLGPLAVHWYGLMYLLGFMLFLWLGKRRARTLNRPGWDDKMLDDLLFYGVLGVVLGGRLGEVLFYHPGYYFSHPLEIFAVWNGGMSFHGGFLGVLVAMSLFAHKRQIVWLQLMDFIAPLVPLGLGAGRIGNFINGELWGRPTDVPWGMVFPHVDNVPRHPSQLYRVRAGRTGAIRAALAVFEQASPNRCSVRPVSHRLRQFPLYCRIHAQPGRWHFWPDDLRCQHGTMAEPADGAGGSRNDDLGL